MRTILILTFALMPFLAAAEKQPEEPQKGGLYTTVYTVRPDFFEKLEEINPTTPPVIASKAFEQQGIAFPEGSSAIYNPATSQLIVKNTLEQMQLVETLVDHVNSIVDKQIYVTVREVTLSGEASERVGFDWMLIPSAPARGDTPGGKGIIVDSRETFFDEFSRPPTIPKKQEASKGPAKNGITAVFTDPQFQIVIRELNQHKGVDLLSAPSVMTRSRQPALIQVGEKRWGIIAVAGADGFTLDLELYLPSHGEALYKKGEKPRPSAKVSVWDGQTVAWSERLDDETYRTVFIKAQLMDPAGTPLNETTPIQPRLNESPPAKDLQGSNEKYEVQKGDTLHSIALRSGISVSKLSDANFLSSNMLQVGQKLIIPEP